MMGRVVNFSIFVLLASVALTHAQYDQSGFISIDCGIPDNSSYTDETTNIKYVSDVGFIDTGVSKSISPVYNNIERQYSNVRSFPDGIKNCYTLTPPPQQKGQSRYFVRASFMYGNYDNKSELPCFEIYLGVNYWSAVCFDDDKTPYTYEILYVPPSSYTYFCLVDIGQGTPFISSLELRLVKDDIYISKSSLELLTRNDLRAFKREGITRYQDDVFDRIWNPSFIMTGVKELSTPLNLALEQNPYLVPSSVMYNAVTSVNASEPLEFGVPPMGSAQYLVYLHFADFQFNETREFTISLNGKDLYGSFKPPYLKTFTIPANVTDTSEILIFSLRKTLESQLPPILNAIEIYYTKNFSNPQTNQQDVDAVKSIKSSYRIRKNWQGDPCTPAEYSWLGLNCFNDSSNIPRIRYLNLSFSGLTGTISPSIENLNMLESLDLSNNNLTGEVPKFLATMQKLLYLNLSGNNLNGTVPPELLKRSANHSLSLSYGGNQYLCPSDSCQTTTPPTNPVKDNNNNNNNNTKKKNNGMVILMIAAVIFLLTALSVLWFCICKKRKSQHNQGWSVATKDASMIDIIKDGPIQAQRQQYTYADVVTITQNFKKVLGKGGFGSVFYGSIDNTQVAVKMLSPSSAQGYKQFKAEAELLMRVHHRNLTTLVGYCDEGNKLGLIYEYMAKGDLETHLSDGDHKPLSWVSRLEIALDSAQGLEYLHHGCKPPIIHRDIKTTNILLNEEMQAKLADFGLSKAFPTEGGTHISTTFAGTLGYFDPEFNINEKSDVYSFGVVLLEILTGKPAIEKDQAITHISKWVAHALETKGDIRKVVDPRLGNDYDVNSVWKAVDIAMECVSLASSQRPMMNQVVIELQRCLEMEKGRIGKADQYESYHDSAQDTNLSIEVSDETPIAR